MAYYQFNLSIDGRSYIRGEKINDHDGFFAIEEPIFHAVQTSIDHIKPNNNIIHLSKNAVVFYFEIDKN